MGAKIQCSTCYVAYHPLCARMAGLRMEIQERQDAAGGVRLISYCPRHCTPKPEQSGAHAGSISGRYCCVGMCFCWRFCFCEAGEGVLCWVIACTEVASGSLILLNSFLTMLSLRLAQQGWQELIVVWKVILICSIMSQVQAVAVDAFSYTARLSYTA